MTGPIYGRSIVRTASGIEQPEGCCKIIVDEGNDGKGIRMMAFIMPQDIRRFDPLSRYPSAVDEIERETGLDFFSELEDKADSSRAADLCGKAG